MIEPSVQATLRYLIPSGEKPVYVASTGGADAQLSINAQFEDHSVAICDARRREVPASLDREGFELRVQATAVEDFYRLDDIRLQYEAELTPLILEASGGSELLIFDHTLRSDSPEVRGQRMTREPASVIHNDYTDASAERRLRDLLPGQEAARRRARRYAIVNVWRPVVGPVLNSSLACCDAHTLSADDLVASERRAQERTGELELVTWNAAHRWYYYPAMRPDEVLLIKTFDAARDGRARRCIHTAFDNPLAPPDAPPRESIESRLLLFF